jgi:CheY-like chemotaxis protein
MANETILVVDDSPEIALFLRQYILEPVGYHVIIAKDGRQGLDMAVNQNPDLIFLDMSMPNMTGLQMLNALRKTSCQAPVIFMTMHGSERIAAEVFRLGVRDYLMKPFTVDEARQAADRSLQEVRLIREKEDLSRQLVVADTIRQTVVTLSHYLNNSMMVVTGGLRLIQESIANNDLDLELFKQVLKDSLDSVSKINAVMRVLQKVTMANDATYYGATRMMDIEAALQDELKRTSK